MRAASSAWQSHVSAENAFIIADLYELTPGDGSAPIRWTSYDQPLSVGGKTYLVGPTLERGGARMASGPETSTLDVTLGCGDGLALPNGLSPQLAAQRGWFRGARVEIDRLYMPTPGDVSLGAIVWFVGSVAQARAGSTSVTLTVNSGIDYLRQLQLPPRVFQATCPHAVYGPACGASEVGRTGNVTVVAGSTPAAVATSASSTAGAWDLGTIAFTSGACAGSSRVIRSWGGTGQPIQLATPLPSAPSIGDTAVVRLGCDKKLETCAAKFGNANRFGGMPFVPRPTSVR